MEKSVYKDVTASDLKYFSGEEKTELKRQLRKPLLSAFDVYKTNVLYGIIEEEQEVNAKIKQWYKSLLNLEDEAFFQVPEEVENYI